MVEVTHTSAPLSDGCVPVGCFEMDWAKIERQAKIHTSNITGGNRTKYSTHSLDRSSSLPLTLSSFPPGSAVGGFVENSQNISYSPNELHEKTHHSSLLPVEYSSPPPPLPSTTTSYLTQEILDLKRLLSTQNEKILKLSHQVEHTSLLEQKYDSLLIKFQQLETEHQNNFKYFTNLSKEQSEYLLQSTNILNKMTWLEELICSTSQDYISKNTFTQFLETCSEQLKGIHMTTEIAKNNTSLCMSFLDSFLVALSQLQQQHHHQSTGSVDQTSTTAGGGGGSSYFMGLEYLISLGSSSGGREKQSAQITNILRSALLSTINREVDVSTANLHKLTISTAEEMRKELSMAMEEIKEEVLRHGQGIGDEVMKSAENTAHSISELNKQIDRVRRKLDGESAAQRESQQVLELEIAELRQSLKRTDDACAKISTITIPASQRNHKALLDEVLRIEESSSQFLSRIESSEKSMKKLENQLLSLQSSQNHVLKSFEEERSERENRKEMDQERFQEWQKEKSELRRLKEKLESFNFTSPAPPVAAPSSPQPVQACIECSNLKSHLLNLDEKTNKLSNTFKALDEGMNALQTEFASMYEEIEKKIEFKQQPPSPAAPAPDFHELLSRLSVMEKELASLQQDFNDQINEIQTKVSMTQNENKKQYSDFETKFQNLRGELSLVREYVDNQISEIQHDARTREVDAIEEGNRTSNSNSLPEIGTKLNKNAFEEAKKLQEEIEKEIAESESKIQRRNRMLQEDEDDEEEEDEELEENDQEEEVAGAEEENEPEESSFLESDEDDDANSPLSKDPAPGGGRNLPEGPDRDDDELSVNSSRSSSHSHHSMRETSRIEDSLDESMEVIESMKHTKPISGLMFEVDSLGNMVPIKRNNKEEPKIEINQPSTTSSGSLLGSGGRNKSVPIPSSNNVSIRSNSLPPPPAVVPLPAPNPSSTRHHHEDTAQCTFCLRRFNIEELKSHLKVCELRTELCKYGCRSRIMASKMEKHLEICPNNPNNKE